MGALMYNKLGFTTLSGSLPKQRNVIILILSVNRETRKLQGTTSTLEEILVLSFLFDNIFHLLFNLSYCKPINTLEHQ